MEAQSESVPPRGSAVRASKLRYPLRSAAKSKEASDVSAPKEKRSAKAIAALTKSVSVLELSGNERSLSTNPPKRLSIPPKPTSTPRTSTRLITTPTSIRSSGAQKSETPLSSISGSSVGRRRFSMISSVSYWTTQIKLAEAASKHSVSLGFFKLALEAGCEPLDRMREELKLYIVQHNLPAELSNNVKAILNMYGVTEDPEQLKLSVQRNSSESPKTSVKSEKGSNKTPSVTVSASKNGNLKPRSLNTEVGQKGGSKVRASSTKNLTKVAVSKENLKKVKKERQEYVEKENDSSMENNPSDGSETTVSKLETSCEEEKENVDNTPTVEVSSE